jgi:hypothetical protein
MVLLPSCISVGVILICLSLVGYTVWQQQRIVRMQQNRLLNAALVVIPTQLLSSPHEPGELLRASISGMQDRDQLSVCNVNTPLEGDQSTRTVGGRAESRQRKSLGAETAPSPFEERANDAIVQCIISGCTVANSVIWLSVVMGLFVTGHYSQRDRYWVRTNSGLIVLAL